MGMFYGFGGLWLVDACKDINWRYYKLWFFYKSLINIYRMYLLRDWAPGRPPGTLYFSIVRCYCRILQLVIWYTTLPVARVTSPTVSVSNLNDASCASIVTTRPNDKVSKASRYKIYVSPTSLCCLKLSKLDLHCNSLGKLHGDSSTALPRLNVAWYCENAILQETL